MQSDSVYFPLSANMRAAGPHSLPGTGPPPSAEDAEPKTSLAAQRCWGSGMHSTLLSCSIAPEIHQPQ